MRVNRIRHNSIIRFSALALLDLCFVQQQVRAQEDGSLVFNTISCGVVRGQSTRFTVFNSNEPPEGGRRPLIFIQVMLFDAAGAVIARSDEIAIPPGEFRSVDFNRDDLPVAGEPGTGRVQTRAQVRYRSFFLIDRTRAIGFVPSIELIDNGTGRTITAVWVTVGFFEVKPRNPQ